MRCLSMTTRPELFRLRAMECEVAARNAKDPELKKAYLELMGGWRDLADQIDNFEQSNLDRGGPYGWSGL